MTFINGPINAARLEGKVGKVKKVIWLFMDRHDSLEEQTRCTNVLSKDVSQYFLDTILAPHKITYDFFIETTITNIHNVHSNLKSKYEPKQIYINETEDMLAKLIKYDQKKNEIKTPITNTRIHFMDIRDQMESIIYESFSKINEYISKRDSHGAIIHMKNMYENLKRIIKIIKNPKPVSISILHDAQIRMSSPKIINYLAYKIRHRYNNQKIKKHMNQLINQLVKVAEKSLPIIHSLSNLSDAQQIEALREIEYLVFDTFFTHLTDVFLLRRILDKSYITNAIIYTGWAHSDYYMSVLVRDYHFKITHSTLNMSTIQVNNIAKTSGFESLLDEPGQCVDISHFPKNFL